MFFKHVPQRDLKDSDAQRDQKIMSRCLAAFGVYCLSNADEVASSHAVIDGGDDNGIDAIYVDDQAKTLIITQAKWTNSGVGCPDKSSVIKFCSGVRDLFSLRREKFKGISDLGWKMIDEAFNSHGLRVLMNLVYTGNAEISDHIKAEVDELLQSVNESTPILFFQYFNLDRIYSFLAEDADTGPVDIDVSFSNWGVVTFPHCSYYGMVPGSELGALWKKYGDRLFSKNLRRKLSSPINDQIARTSVEDPAHFWYFNNGVTIICDSVQKAAVGGGSREVGLFRAKNAAVVNGAQTVSSIGTMLSSGHSLNDVFVQLRIIEVGEDGSSFGDQVTRFNNYQNRIEPRDLMAQEANQKRLRKELSFEGYEYKIQRGDFDACERIIDFEESTLGLACGSGSIDLAVAAKRDIGSLWGRQDLYHRIYNPSLSGVDLISRVLFMRGAFSWMEEVNSKCDSEVDRVILAHGDLFLLFSLFEQARCEKAWNFSDASGSPDSLLGFFQAKGNRYLQLMREFLHKPNNQHMITLGFKNLKFIELMRDYCIKNFGKEVVQQAMLDLEYEE